MHVAVSSLFRSRCPAILLPILCQGSAAKQGSHSIPQMVVDGTGGAADLAALGEVLDVTVASVLSAWNGPGSFLCSLLKLWTPFLQTSQ